MVKQPTAKGAWKRRERPVAACQARPKISEDDLKLLAEQMRTRFKWDQDPRFFQLQGVKAQLEGIDAVIQAPTGSGKTAIAAGPHVWPSSAGKITIMVCPLLALEEEMVETFKTEFGLTAVAINSINGSCSPIITHNILAGQYRVILISPEMLQSRSFINRVLRNTGFARRVLSVVIDEAHCISHWGANFRKKYASLGILRAFLPRDTPFIAVTATLTPRVRRDLHSKLHFPKTGSMFVNVGNDRPNISLVVRACEHPQNTYADLDFVLPQTIESPLDIPKTYIYVDNIKTGSEIIDHLESLLRECSPSLSSSGLIQPFNATMSHEYRKHAMAAFRHNEENLQEFNDTNSGPIRILVCTDAAGMGCNVSDVDVVVQWKLPATFSNFIQRAGRAARGRTRTGLAVLLVERSAYSVNLTEENTSESSTPSKAKHRQHHSTRPRGKGKLPKDYAKKHGVDRGGSKAHDIALNPSDQPSLNPDAADEGLLTFVQSTQCRRKVWQSAFESPNLNTNVLPHIPCCDICDPTLFDRTRPGQRPGGRVGKLPARGEPDDEAWSALDQWRENILQRDHTHSELDVTAILDNAMVDLLASIGSISPALLTRLLRPSWLWWNRYGSELSTYLTTLQITFRPIKKTVKKRTTEDNSDTHNDAEPHAKRIHTSTPGSSHPDVHISHPQFTFAPPQTPSQMSMHPPAAFPCAHHHAVAPSAPSTSTPSSTSVAEHAGFPVWPPSPSPFIHTGFPSAHLIPTPSSSYAGHGTQFRFVHEDGTRGSGRGRGRGRARTRRQ